MTAKFEIRLHTMAKMKKAGVTAPEARYSSASYRARSFKTKHSYKVIGTALKIE